METFGFNKYIKGQHRVGIFNYYETRPSGIVMPNVVGAFYNPTEDEESQDYKLDYPDFIFPSQEQIDSLMRSLGKESVSDIEYEENGIDINQTFPVEVLESSHIGVIVDAALRYSTDIMQESTLGFVTFEDHAPEKYREIVSAISPTIYAMAERMKQGQSTEEVHESVINTRIVEPDYHTGMYL